MADEDPYSDTQAVAAGLLLRLWSEARNSICDCDAPDSADSAGDDNDNLTSHCGKDLTYMSSLVSTPCLPDSEDDTTDEESPGGAHEGKQLTWKRLRGLGWTYVPGSRLGESLIDFFYLAPGINVERAVKYKNAFSSTEQVQAYLAGGELPASGSTLGKRRRDSPSSDEQSEPIGVHTPKNTRHNRLGKGICGVMSKRGMPCPQRAGACPYHNTVAYKNAEEEEMEMGDDDEEHDIDDGLCGVVSQRGLRCPHRREVCPYHTEAQRSCARRSDHGQSVSKDMQGTAKKTRNTARRDGDSDRRFDRPKTADDLVNGDTTEELCGVISQRGLPCAHRKHICPYHSENGSRRAKPKVVTAEIDSDHTKDVSAEPQIGRRAKETPQSPSEMESGEEGKLSWKDLRRQGWSYVPGSRLGESLIDYFYLPPGVAVESAVKYKNAFDSMSQVQAWLAGDAIEDRRPEGKRRRDTPYFFHHMSSSPTDRSRRSPDARTGRTGPGGAEFHDTKILDDGDDGDSDFEEGYSGRARSQCGSPTGRYNGSSQMCGVMSQRGLRCPQKRGACPYHSNRKRVQQEEKAAEEKAAEEKAQDESAAKQVGSEINTEAAVKSVLADIIPEEQNRDQHQQNATEISAQS